MKKSRVKGAHFTIDFFGCDPHQIDSPKFWHTELPASAHVARMDILHSYFHKFDPQGITGFLLLSSSHISFHTWPEYNYVACDVFSCSHDEETYRAVQYLRKVLTHKRVEIHKIKRGYVVMDFITSPIFSTGKKENIRVEKKVAEIDSSFQNIVIADTVEYGRTMVIDGLVQTSHLDHELYDDALLNKLSSQDKHILILGGGDGYVAERALMKNPHLKITIVDLDPEVVGCARKYLGQKIFDHQNITLNIGDALTYMKTLVESGNFKFDGIISDLTDNPVRGENTRKGLVKFYKEVFGLAHTLLNDGGWISVQSGASKVVKKYVDAVKILSKLLEEDFGSVERKDVFIPSFSERNAFLFSKK